jgi:two-component system, response regulator PdtaR
MKVFSMRKPARTVAAAEPVSALPLGISRRAFSRDGMSGAPKTSVRSERVLLVEDDFLVASQIEGALSDAGFNVVGIAGSADEAMELASSEQPALCVMDIRLAGARDGIDAALELFKTRGLRCIFATAHSDAEARRRAEAAAPLGWLQKPYSPAALVAMVRDAVRELGGNRD